MVNVYIALSEFARGKFIDGGLPPESITVKPNFLGSDPGMGKGEGAYALFVGRLGEEKGVRLLAEAWCRLSGIPLIVASDLMLALSKTDDGKFVLTTEARSPR